MHLRLVQAPIVAQIEFQLVFVMGQAHAVCVLAMIHVLASVVALTTAAAVAVAVAVCVHCSFACCSCP